VPLLTIGWSLLLRTPQQRFPMLFSGLDNPQKLSFSVGDLDPSNTWFLRPTRVSAQTASRSVQSFLHSTSVWPRHIYTDRHTDHAECDICSNLCYACDATWNIKMFWYLYGLTFFSFEHWLSDSSLCFHPSAVPEETHPLQ